MSNIRAAFMGEEHATELSNHEAEMRRQREQRGKMVLGVLAIVAMLVIILLTVAAFCGAVLMIRATF